MLKKDLLELIKDIEDDKDVDEILATSELATKFGGLDVFKQKVNTDKDFKSFIDSLKDQHLNKGLETWKANNLQNLIDDAVAKANPKETEDQKKIRELTERLNKQDAEKKKSDLLNKVLTYAQEKEISPELTKYLDKFIEDDEETTIKNVDEFITDLSKSDETKFKERLKVNSYTPPSGGSDPEGGLDFISVIKENQVKRD
ncbi:DUF4355 domain-containing protein [Clostridium botulinum]|nr:DUF4355 domain-containing protein [Clostridium botulinum]